MMKQKGNTLNKKTLFIGLDGATWDIINPLIAAGKLPNLQKLIETGSHGVLMSTEAMISPSVWTTILTGKTANKHGIHNFMTMQNQLKAKRIWDIFEDFDKTVGAVGFLMTWPPKLKNDGFLIPDHFAPDGQSIPQDASFLWEITKNRQLEGGLKFSNLIQYVWKALQYGINLGNLFFAGKTFLWRKLAKPKYIDYFHREVALFSLFTEKIFLKLCRKFNPDFAAVYFPGTDVVSHKYWCYYKPEDFEDLESEEIEKYRDIIPTQYMICDAAIGRIVNYFKKNHQSVDVVIVSDHGFQSSKEAKYHPSVKIEFLLDHFGMREKMSYTKIGHNTIVHANDADEKKKLAALKEFEKSILTIKDTDKDISLFQTEYIEDYLKISAAPLWKGYQFEDKINLNGQQKKVEDVLEKGVLLTGKHAREGIIIMNGDSIKSNYEISDASVFDVTPTILALNNMPIAEDMDGKVLTDAIADSFLKDYPIKKVASYGTPDDFTFSESEQNVVKDQEDTIKERLRSLGYLE